MYRMIQRYNNNVVLANNKISDAVLVGKGIGFQKKRGDTIDDSEIIDIYFQTTTLPFEQIVSLCNNVSEKEFECLEEIVSAAKSCLHVKINPNLLFSLLDHIVYAIQRQKNEERVVLPIEWEVQKYYPKEYALAEKSMQKINTTFKCSLPKSEIVMITLHFINAQNEAHSDHELIEILELTNEIVKIVKYHFSIDFEEDSIIFQRFITHIRYYLMRQQRGEKLQGDDVLLKVVMEKYPKESECMKKITEFMKLHTEYEVPNSEKMYLILHIGNLTRT